MASVTPSVQGTPGPGGITCTSNDPPTVIEAPTPINVLVAIQPTENPQPSATQRSFTFDASGTTVTPTDMTLSYAWTLPDGSTGSGARFTANLACSATDQNVTVNLVVHAVKGTADKTFTGSRLITVKACPAVTAAFSAASEGSTFATTTYDFNASATTAKPAGASLSYSWAFGDGSSGTGESASHTYDCILLTAHKVTVTLTVTAEWPGVTLTSTAHQAVTVAGCTRVRVPVPPKAVNDTFAVSGTGSVTGNVLTNDSPGKASNGRPFRLRVIIGTRPAHGRVVVSPLIYPTSGAGTFVYTANRGFCGVDSFRYVIRPPATDSPQLASAATVYLYVCGSNLPPYLNGLAAQAQAAGDRQAAGLLRSAARSAGNGQTADALADVTSALTAARGALLKQGITYAEQQLEA